jgi:hypothetical protein
MKEQSDHSILPAESEEILFACPYCENGLSLPQGALRYFTCEHCGKRLDLPAQFSFNRGVEAFREGYAVYQASSHRRKKVPTFDAREQPIIRFFEEAYFAIQQAFTGDLAEPQRILGVEMMVNMAQFFLQRSMISSMEYSYWGMLMKEHSAQEEYDVLRQKLAQNAHGLGSIMQIRLRSRKSQLQRALIDIDEKIRHLEDNMALTYPIHARKSHWKATD